MEVDLGLNLLHSIVHSTALSRYSFIHLIIHSYIYSYIQSVSRTLLYYLVIPCNIMINNIAAGPKLSWFHCVCNTV